MWYNKGKAKRSVATMLTRSYEGISYENINLSKEERAEKEQAELVPLMTGGKLKPYQVKGVKWLISLWQNGLNGILADQMGLGQTIQTIGFLAHLKGKGSDGPYMIIAPLSTLSNWANEISRFAPCLNAIIYHGSQKDREEIRMRHMPFTIGKKFPIIIRSYEVVMNDAKKRLRHYNWKYLVVDEGHRLKNSQCKLVKVLKWLRVDNKLLLTRTPLQNNLAELFNLCGKCGNEDTKERRTSNVYVVAKLHTILRPFLLRRMKEDVEHMLPRKKQIILYATLTDHQKNFHDHLVNRTLELYLKEKVDTGFYPHVEQIVGQCGKFQLLERLLQKLFSRKQYQYEMHYNFLCEDGIVKLSGTKLATLLFFGLGNTNMKCVIISLVKMVSSSYLGLNWRPCFSLDWVHIYGLAKTVVRKEGKDVKRL
ncbi:ATP-dependent DNA helicase DDM1 [Tanacetum coccineum]